VRIVAQVLGVGVRHDAEEPQRPVASGRCQWPSQQTALYINGGNLEFLYIFINRERKRKTKDTHTTTLYPTTTTTSSATNSQALFRSLSLYRPARRALTLTPSSTTPRARTLLNHTKKLVPPQRQRQRPHSYVLPPRPGRRIVTQ